MLGGEEEKDPDAQKKEEERQEALRQQEEERKAKHARMEAEREKVRQQIRDKIQYLGQLSTMSCEQEVFSSKTQRFISLAFFSNGTTFKWQRNSPMIP
ncbi:UNVERIFIED_CONTAM: hypothetical protein K2H54_039951 [Gekko kuhli]